MCDIAELDPGSVGLALSYAMTLTGMFQWGVRQSAEIENMVRQFTLSHLFALFCNMDEMLDRRASVHHSVN